MSAHDAQSVVTKSIIVEVERERAFRLWTEQVRLWWPAGHSLSGDPHTEVFIEGKVGGRFYERTSNGVEYEWGQVVVWEPPSGLTYTWYLGSSQELPTRVEVQFIPLSETATRIEIEHRGPDLIGGLWWQRQTGFRAAWDSVLSRFGVFLTDE